MEFNLYPAFWLQKSWGMEHLLLSPCRAGIPPIEDRMDAECQSALSRASCLTASTSAQWPLSRYIISSILTTPLWATLLFLPLISRREQAYISKWRPQAEMVEPRQSDSGFWACLLCCVFYVLELCLILDEEKLAIKGSIGIISRFWMWTVY